MLYYFLSVFFAAPALFLCIKDIRSRPSDTRPLKLRVAVTFTVMLVLCLDYVFCNGKPSMPCLCSDISTYAVMLLMMPCSYERLKPSAVFMMYSVGPVVLVAVLLSSVSASCRAPVVLFMEGTLISVYMVYRAAIKYHRIRPLFRNSAVWNAVEEHARCMYVVLLLFLLEACMMAIYFDSVTICFITGIAMCVFSFICYLRSSTGRLLFLPEKKEIVIKEAIDGNLREIKVDKPDEGQKMALLYGRILEYMEKNAPFLEEDFSLPQMATDLYSNRVYLSKTINMMSGRNFCQFINWYRVTHAKEMMRKDPHLKVLEVATMSGFHSVVSFNQAFKMYEGTTPSVWLQSIKLEKGVTAED